MEEKTQAKSCSFIKRNGNDTIHYELLCRVAQIDKLKEISEKYGLNKMTYNGKGNAQLCCQKKNCNFRAIYVDKKSAIYAIAGRQHTCGHANPGEEYLKQKHAHDGTHSPLSLLANSKSLSVKLEPTIIDIHGVEWRLLANNLNNQEQLQAICSQNLLVRCGVHESKKNRSYFKFSCSSINCEFRARFIPLKRALYVAGKHNRDCNNNRASRNNSGTNLPKMKRQFAIKSVSVNPFKGHRALGKRTSARLSARQCLHESSSNNNNTSSEEKRARKRKKRDIEDDEVQLVVEKENIKREKSRNSDDGISKKRRTNGLDRSPAGKVAKKQEDVIEEGPLKNNQFNEEVGTSTSALQENDRQSYPPHIDHDGNKWDFLAPSGFLESHYPVLGLERLYECAHSSVLICSKRYSNKCPYMMLFIKKKGCAYQRNVHSHEIDTTTPEMLLKGRTPSPKKVGPDADIAREMDLSGWKCIEENVQTKKQMEIVRHRLMVSHFRDYNSIRSFRCFHNRCTLKLRWLKLRGEVWQLGEHSRSHEIPDSHPKIEVQQSSAKRSLKMPAPL